MNSQSLQGNSVSRRLLLKGSTASVLTSSVAAWLSNVPYVHPGGSDLVKVGLVGCGARGTGAAEQVVRAAPNVQLVAMGDTFEDRLHESREKLLQQHRGKIQVSRDRCFIGFDAYQKVIDSDINYVILATPPGFRPLHLKAAVESGKHIFAEKPVAVDGPGIRMCLTLYEQAKSKALGIAVGTQRRHQRGYVETVQRIRDGTIGPILAARCYWNGGGVWKKDRQPGWTDMEYQLRNWYYFTWLSGDHIVEQHIHNLDVVNWALRSHPLRAVGIGGRQVRTGSEYGHIYDHFAIDYEYETGVHVMSMCRQINGCDNDVSEVLVGTKGTCHVNQYRIAGEKDWRFSTKDNDAYVQEHVDLIESIRDGRPINELKHGAESSLTAIMGRMAAYTGKTVTWEQALNSQANLMPPELTWGAMPFPQVAMPGQTGLV